MAADTTDNNYKLQVLARYAREDEAGPAHIDEFIFVIDFILLSEIGDRQLQPAMLEATDGT